MQNLLYLHQGSSNIQYWLVIRYPWRQMFYLISGCMHPLILLSRLSEIIACGSALFEEDNFILSPWKASKASLVCSPTNELVLQKIKRSRRTSSFLFVVYHLQIHLYAVVQHAV